MKTSLLLLLLAVASGPARALWCHVCSSASDCENAQTCPPSSHHCRTQYKVDLLRGNLVQKGCVESCTPDTYQSGQVGSGTSRTLCCQSDLCNSGKLPDRVPSRAPARALLSGSVLSLALALGLLALLWAPRL